jgi:hypothetical protein
MSEEFRPGLARALETGRYRQVGGVGLAAAILIGVTEVADVLGTWSDWHRYQVLSDYLAEKPITLDDLSAADRISAATAVGYLIIQLAAATMFVVWLWRVRRNAEVLCAAPHRRARGWVIWSWICPVVNLWFPFMILDDVHRASRPGNAPDLGALWTVPRSRLLGAWWALWLAGLIIARFNVTSTRNGVLTLDSFFGVAIVSTISTVLMIGAAVMIIVIMREISRWQTP